MAAQIKETIDVLLAESFKELACQQPIEKITIKEITDKAGVIRPTFYNHFQDKYELLEWIIKKQILEPIRPLIMADMIDEGLMLTFTTLEKEKDFYGKAVKLEGQNSFESIVKKCIMETLLEVLSLQQEGKTEKKSKYPWLTPESVAEFYAQSMCFMIVNWIETGMSVTPREITDIYNYIMSTPMNEVLKEL
ncbi:TetR/AcrR family transcriptional regulator C-terminal domain-containing protein [Roseburia sp. 499]|uniref:TetR/AcrR family transcriptional regulator C-terminal domain-containing protein n=1 Tax=Roseburia sp. 499 TaxID=1261634 RepID=UPI000952FC67|nr:TetR/AcrR family transcriptional regulator C-terminal domain-containing protein [Roseburia sp. 499]WVK69496.1 TetR/AcrR family transcriptional regulator C-terminal domain-containing protein [Roseburia sp. 499]